MASGTSVNSCVDKKQLLPCVYRGVMQRLVNWMVATRNKYPQTMIYSTKIDFKAAFRRLHLNSSTAVQCCTQIPELEIGLMTLCLTFGGAPCPFEWGVISELTCDLATTILLNENWDPNKLHAPNQDEFPEPRFFHDNTPFGEGRELIVEVEVNKFGIHDIYIDDLIGLGLDLPNLNNCKRSERAPLLAMDICAHRPDPNEPIPHYEMAARKKLDAKGLLSKVKMIFGWLWNFRNLTISLPENKLIAWTDGIKNLIAKKKVCEKGLETTIGRLTHVSMIIPPVHHFLSRLRELLYRIKNNNRRMSNIPTVCINNLHLMKDFLQWGNKGISMNRIAYQKPTHVYQGDSCLAGLGGFSHKGFAWRYYLPPKLQGGASNNLLEHMVSIISPWIDIIAGQLKDGDCSLSMTDSTTSEGRTRKTNFKEDVGGIQATIRIKVARSHASRFMTHKI
jgi:hypothetical protein